MRSPRAIAVARESVKNSFRFLSISELIVNSLSAFELSCLFGLLYPMEAVAMERYSEEIEASDAGLV
jgi:hypothetical protein